MKGKRQPVIAWEYGSAKQPLIFPSQTQAARWFSLPHTCAAAAWIRAINKGFPLYKDGVKFFVDILFTGE